jgi:hypothetical protein
MVVGEVAEYGDEGEDCEAAPAEDCVDEVPVAHEVLAAPAEDFVDEVPVAHEVLAAHSPLLVLGL